MNPLLMFWNLQKAAVKTFVRFSIDILMVLESPESYLKSQGGCREPVYILFQ